MHRIAQVRKGWPHRQGKKGTSWVYVESGKFSLFRWLQEDVPSRKKAVGFNFLSAAGKAEVLPGPSKGRSSNIPVVRWMLRRNGMGRVVSAIDTFQNFSVVCVFLILWLLVPNVIYGLDLKIKCHRKPDSKLRWWKRRWLPNHLILYEEIYIIRSIFGRNALPILQFSFIDLYIQNRGNGVLSLLTLDIRLVMKSIRPYLGIVRIFGIFILIFMFQERRLLILWNKVGIILWRSPIYLITILQF